jgi:hypothetical protein
MSEQKSGGPDKGTASATSGPIEISPDHMKKTDGQLRPAPPPDAELHPAPNAPGKPQ